MRSQGLGALVERPGEHSGGFGEFDGHAGPLGPLAGEDEHGLAGHGRAPHEVRRRGVPGQRGQAPEEVAALAAQYHRPMLEGGARGREAVAQIHGTQPGIGLDALQQPGGLRGQRGLRPAGNHPGHQSRTATVRHEGGRRRLCDRRRLLHDHMSVGAAHPERADAGDQGPIRTRPGTRSRPHAQVQLVERDGRRRRFEVQTRRQRPRLDAERDFEQADDAGGRLQMADIGLDGPDDERAVRRAEGSHRRTEGGGLDRIAAPGPGAVQLHVLHLYGRDTGPRARSPHHVRLGVGVGHGQPIGGTVVVHRAAPDHAVDPVLIRQRAGQRLEHDDDPALAAYEPVRAGIEGETTAVRGQTSEPCRGQGPLRQDVEVHPARQRESRLPAPQALDRQMHGDQGRSLRGVHRQAGPPQPKGVRHAIGDEASVQTRQGVLGDGGGSLPIQQPGVLIPHRPDEHRRPAAGQGCGEDAPVFERLPRQFQHQPLLGIHGDGLTG